MSKKKKSKHYRKKLPRKLLFIKSSDKDFIETWGMRKDGTTARDPLDFPASWRMVLCGSNGCGKTCMIKNIILRTQQSRRPFERIFVLHQDKRAKEYQDIGAEILTELPENDFWMGYDDDGDSDGSLSDEESEPERPKTLIVIDDINFKDMDKRQGMLLNRLVGMISSHCNVSIACLTQDVFEIPSIVRKCANIWCIWRPSDDDQLNTIARRVGYKSKEFKELFNELAINSEDSIMIDKTPKTPYPLRLNGYHLIQKFAK